MSLSVMMASSIALQPTAGIRDHCLKPKRNVLSGPVRLKPQVKRASVICSGAMSARCSAEQTQTITR
ncbi:Unknown protein [Striga hermonthica]|uniref:Uncharacterized protein n=1 Tax=Striga hermonthica TaxID=68872 RepID=A0A9N7NI87_STRHE|nr:Unknown protein [Striga hermonthica]